jgi:hypothetical protein
MIITEFHRQHFKPTYLYIKQHSDTEKLYFGKTTRSDVERYTGSGIHWGRHISAHGKDKVVTLWYCLFTDIDTLLETALEMSRIMNITESADWLNFKPETGLDGGSVKGFNGWAGKKHSESHKKYLSEKYKGHKVTDKAYAAIRQNCRPRPGAENTNAKNIFIYDSNNVLMAETHGNFEKTCLEQGWPIGALKGSYLKDGKPIFTSKSPGRLKDLTMLAYKGWYAKIIK